MRKYDQKDISFSEQELWFLSSLFAPTIVVGLPDPIQGLLTREVEQLRKRVQKSMLTKKVIDIDRNDQIEVREPYASWIQGITSPRHTILIVLREGNQTEKTCSYHFTENQIIGLSQQRGAEYSIGPVQTSTVITEHLMEPLVAGIYDERDETSIDLPAKDFEKARVEIENGHKAKARKILGGILSTDGQFERIAKAASKSILRFSLVAFLNRGQTDIHSTRGFSVLASEDDILLLRAKDADLTSLQIRSVSKIELVNTIRSYIPEMEVAS